MINVLLVGNGRMGKLIQEVISETEGICVADVVDDTCPEKLQSAPAYDVVMDFSAPASLPGVFDYVKRTGAALVSGTTGYSERELELIKELSEHAAVIHSANYSLGIAVFRRVLSEITPVLKDSFDIEITETHHHGKADAPSGTAKLLLAAVDPGGEYDAVYGRQGNCGARPKKEIGIHALRGGTVAGTHTVSFFGDDEIFEITHTATSRRIFVNGAVKTALAIAGKPPKMYSLEELIFNK